MRSTHPECTRHTSPQEPRGRQSTKAAAREYPDCLGMWCTEASRKAGIQEPFRHIFCTPHGLKDEPSWAANESYQCSVSHYGTTDKHGRERKQFAAPSLDLFGTFLNKRKIQSEGGKNELKLHGGGSDYGETLVMMMTAIALKKAFI
ncbi:unnamed protein product [Prorocentrum cordatum]|uniref:Poly(ADP-ribose) glycohydrolase n=1 Tax=Prorocentrum cordatum TaxID=2364126 RepID=A0ABN9PA47_9DINO|nr:unnamed protein product [Polarella glacialis]